MKENILEAFRNLGFKLEEEEGMGYCFTYEGLNLIYVYNEDDEEFLNIALPGIMPVEGGKASQTFALLEKLNSTLKYVKAHMLGDRIWLFYERALIGQREKNAEGQPVGEEDLEAVISHMIIHLEGGYRFACKAMAEIEKTVADLYSCDDSADDTEETVAEEITDDGDNE